VNAAVANIAPIAGKLAKCIRMLGDKNRGERAAAFRVLERTMESNGVDWNDLGDRIEQPGLSTADMEAILERGKELGRQETRGASNGHGTPYASSHGTPGNHQMPSLLDMVMFCFNRVDQLPRDKDRDFIHDIHRRAIWRYGASAKQQIWIEDLYFKLGGTI